MSPAEAGRWSGGLAGLLLWLALPLVVLEGSTAKHAYRCRGRHFTGEFDECFNDYLPVLEVVFVPLFILVTSYAFARFAFTLFAPPQRGGGRMWWFSAKAGSPAGWPLLQAAACVGILWAVWRMLTYAFVDEMMPFHLYWAAFALWFACGALLGLHDCRSEQPGAA